jgi:hypothetical protein
MVKSEQVSEYYDLMNQIVFDFNAADFSRISEKIRHLVYDMEVSVSEPEIYPAVTPLLLVLIQHSYMDEIDYLTDRASTQERVIAARRIANQLVDAINSDNPGAASQHVHTLMMEYFPILMHRASKDIGVLLSQCGRLLDGEATDISLRFYAIQKHFHLLDSDTCYWNDIQRCVYPELGCIFIHTPKTGGSSLRRALDDMCRNREMPPNMEILEAALRNQKKARTHAKAHHLRDIVGEAVWSSFFSFAFVRNPWNVMVSQYEWWRQAAAFNPAYRAGVEAIGKMDFDTFVRSAYASEQTAGNIGLIGDWFNKDEVLQVDFVGKLENFDNDWQTICNRLDVIPQPMPPKKHGATKRQNYRSYYTEETREIVGSRFAGIIRDYDYEF